MTGEKDFFSWICAGVCFLLLILPVPTFAGTGGVSIDLTTYGLNAEGKRIPYVQQSDLVPNEEIPYIIGVKNKGNPCWVRVHAEYRTSDNNIRPEDSWLKGIDRTDWVKRENYWYYRYPLDAGESADLCHAVQIPDLKEVPETVVCQIVSRAEAVQAANVTPDFDAENPFEGLLIDGSTAGQENMEADRFDIRYEGGADNIVDGSGLFHDIDGMMPGDGKTGSITVRNSNHYTIKVILKESGDQVDDVLLKAMKMRISKGGSSLYEGAFTDHALKNGLSLGDFPAGSETAVQFRIWLPRDAGNETAFRNIKVAWTFAAERAEAGSGGSGSSGSGGSGTSGSGGSGSSGSNGSGCTTVPTLYSCPDGSVRAGYTGGHWNLIDENKHRWEYVLADGTKAVNGWMYLYNPYSGDKEKSNWFCFGSDGIMQYGWIQTSNGNWYFCHEVSDGNLGKMVKGWHHDTDDERSYYLDPVTGIMQSGWREIGGNYYYFAATEDIPRQNWFWNSGIGRWIYDRMGYRTYGSMYRNEQTPDGYHVDASGIWDGITAVSGKLGGGR